MTAIHFPAELFQRMDDSRDAEFYSMARLVTHIDDATIAALTQLYRELVPAGADVLDLMSSWISHLPPELQLGRVAGLGMNAEELKQNPRLTEAVVQDLNAEPELPWPAATFDAVLNAVSIQYLTRPVEVYASVRRILKPGGLAIVATSHRCFPTKAIAAWHACNPIERLQLVRAYFEAAEGYEPVQFVDRSPEGADPLLVVVARRVDASVLS